MRQTPSRREVRYEWQRLELLQPLDVSWTLGRSDGEDPVYAPEAARA